MVATRRRRHASSSKLAASDEAAGGGSDPSAAGGGSDPSAAGGGSDPSAAGGGSQASANDALQWTPDTLVLDTVDAALSTCGVGNRARTRVRSALLRSRSAGEFTDHFARLVTLHTAGDPGRISEEATLDLSPDSFDAIVAGGEQERIQRQQRQQRQHELDQVSREATRVGGALRCRQCGGDSVTVQQKQTRSADEGMTVFCGCETCGSQWRMS